MNIHQFRFVQEAVRQNFNLTHVAKALFTSQPGVSKAIIELEDELGTEIFRRHGKRIRDLTEPGKHIVRSIERILSEVEKLKKIGAEYVASDQGNFVIATTHTQARYALPAIIAEFTKRFPKVRVSLQQGSPEHLAHLVVNGHADIAIATEGLANFPGLIALPGYQWQHIVVVPHGHPLLIKKPLAIEDLAQYPIITYDIAFAGRSKINSAFAKKGLTPDVVLEAIDADVIKTYVETGLGVGIVAGGAYDANRDQALAMLPAGHLFGTNTTRIALKKDAYLRAYTYIFIELFAPSLTKKLIDQAILDPAEFDKKSIYTI
jgi:LysR family cys regulon transcriptional activator